MERRLLGDTGIEVSALCLGTMSFGEQNTEAEAHRQLDQAIDAGVNFIDTAEMYPVPTRAETQGRTEQCIGTWLASSRVPRDQVILTTKVSGPGFSATHIRGGPRLNAEHIHKAVEASLRRLQTDYIDLYLVHWPERDANYFGRRDYPCTDAADAIPIAETWEALCRLVENGQVRAVGVSNETPWGLSEYLRLSRETGGPRVATIQNPYSLLNRNFEIGLAEIALRERCGLMAYSPLGFGVLTGKHQHGHPPGSRLQLWSQFTRYSNPQAHAATAQYLELARRHGLKPAQMALSFVRQQPFVTSVVIGATTEDQVRENLDSTDVELSAELLREVDTIHKLQPNPAP